MTRSSRMRGNNDKYLVPGIIIIVFAVIFIFEGQLIYTMFTFRSTDEADMEIEQEAAAESESEAVIEAETAAAPALAAESVPAAESVSVTAGNTSLAGLPDDMNNRTVSETEASVAVSGQNGYGIVKEQSTPVDDSYFSDAAFIGDSRMEGFRNTSGITQGTFFTSVGMTLESMANSAIISSGGSTVTVAAALSGGTYGKIYIMLGANDLGTYDWDEFRENLISTLARFQEIQPNAIIYICSCIYVEEDKVTTGDYVNNANVDILNSILLEVCEEEGYYYLDINEILSDGNGSLIAGASADGVHLNEPYCRAMLDYMKSHYIPTGSQTESSAEAGAEMTGRNN